MKTRNVGQIEDKNSFRRKDDDYPFGCSYYRPNENCSIYRFEREWDFQNRKIYLDDYSEQEQLRKEYFDKKGGTILKDLMGESE